MLEKIEGFILSETPYGETSKIINVLTKEHGLVGVLAKGAKSVKSKFRATTGKYNYINLEIYYKDNKLSTLVSCDAINPLKRIRSDLTLISYITYISDLVYQVIKQSSDKTIYDLLISTILKIEDGLDPGILTNILEIKLLKYLGVDINLDSCAICGNNKNIVTIDGSRGGLICTSCYVNEKIVSIKSIKILRMYYYVDISSIATLNIEKQVQDEIDQFINAYYEDFTGIYIQSKKFLKNIVSI